jgi:nucleolar protein 12
MSKVDAPLDEVALKKEGKKTDKKAKKDKKVKKVKEAKQVDAGLQLFKGKASELDGVFGKGVSFSSLSIDTSADSQSEYALPKSAPVLRAAVASSSKVAEGEKDRSTKRQKKDSKVLIDSEDEEEAAPAPTAGPSKAVEEEDEDNDAELSEGSEIDTDEELVHETTDTTSKRKRKLATKLPKYTPADETSQDRDRRSIFVGNLPIEVTKSKVSHHPHSRYQD